MRFVLAFFLLAHGVAHLVGFVSSWKLATLAELPYKTTVFSGRIDVGDAGIRVLGVLWLLTALAFLIAASARGHGDGLGQSFHACGCHRVPRCCAW